MSAMGTVFVDTSVLIAAEDVAGGGLYRATLDWLDALWRTRTGRTGNQALVEFYDQVTTAATPMPQGDARAAIRRYQTWAPWKTDAGRGLRPAQRLQPHAEPAPAPRRGIRRRDRAAPAAATGPRAARRRLRRKEDP